MFVTKYNASGNDFIIFHTFMDIDRSKLAKTLCHRQSGIGADGLVVVLPHHRHDFIWQFYNSDGSKASMCGNASRAVAHYAYTNGLCKHKMAFVTEAGVIEASVSGDFVTSDLTPPKIVQKDISSGFGNCWLIDTGVPHIVAYVDSVDKFDLNEAKSLRKRYDANVNIWTMQEDKIYVRTFERGVEDETLACGTGMAAAFVQAMEQNKVGCKVQAVPKSLEKLYLSYEDGKIKFGGSVQQVFVTQYSSLQN